MWLKYKDYHPGIPTMLSFFVMGLGQILMGEIERGVFFLFCEIIGTLAIFSIVKKGIVFKLICFSSSGLGAIIIGVIVVILIILWIYNLKDAYTLGVIAPVLVAYQRTQMFKALRSGAPIKALPAGRYFLKAQNEERKYFSFPKWLTVGSVMFVGGMLVYINIPYMEVFGKEKVGCISYEYKFKFKFNKDYVKRRKIFKGEEPVIFGTTFEGRKKIVELFRKGEFNKLEKLMESIPEEARKKDFILSKIREVMESEWK